MMTSRHIPYEIILLTGLYLTGYRTTPQISYQRDVQPIFVDKCMGCHTPPYGAGYRQTGLNLESYTSLMKGSIYGPVVVPGNSKMSPLNMLVEGRAGDLSRQMEIRHTPMTEHEIGILRLWVEQGAPDLALPRHSMNV
jgi:Planctomycete cytochrome C